MPVDPESEAELLRSRELIEAARREREQLLEQIQESEKTIAKSRELIGRIDEMLARLGSRPPGTVPF
jgi:chromosome segregation ATPase